MAKQNTEITFPINVGKRPLTIDIDNYFSTDDRYYDETGYNILEGCDNDQVFFSTDFTQRDHLTEEENIFFNMDNRTKYQEKFAFNFKFRFDSNSAFANTHDSTILQTKVISKGKVEYIFNLTIKFVDLDAMFAAATVGMSTEEKLDYQRS